MAEPERILELAQAVNTVANERIRAIKQVTAQSRILSLNALIEAGRSGQAGKGFAVVAAEVKNVSQDIETITRSLEGELSTKILDLMTLGESIVQQLRGSRLADLALHMIEIVDRNLYERSCDVRWWATDSAVVDLLQKPSVESANGASKRLGVILDSYTVYLDIWVVGRDGKVIANGRPEQFPRVVGSDVLAQSWFREALATADGTEFAVADVGINLELDSAQTVPYAAAVRAGGNAQGEVLGVLAIFFDWETQAQAVVSGVRLEADEKVGTRCLLLDGHQRIIAASDRKGLLTETVPLHHRGSSTGSYNEGESVVGFALTPGYETYKGLGWYGAIVQQSKKLTSSSTTPATRGGSPSR